MNPYFRDFSKPLPSIDLTGTPPKMATEWSIAKDVIGKLLDQAETNAHQLGTIRATLLVNFGVGTPGNHYGYEVQEPDKKTTLTILVEILENLTSRLPK